MITIQPTDSQKSGPSVRPTRRVSAEPMTDPRVEHGVEQSTAKFTTT